MIRTAAILLALAGPAQAGAERVIAPVDFEAMTTGVTLYFDRDGQPYGAETYLQGRQVIWRYADGTCAAGHWFADGQSICFVYEGNPAPQCWLFVERDNGFFARVAGLASGDPSEIRLASESPEPLNCPAQNLGV